MIIPLFGTAYGSKSETVSAQNRVNMYAEPQREPEKGDPLVLYCTPGLTAFSYLGAYPARGMRAMGDYLYVVAGSGLYRVANDGTYTSLGTLLTTTGLVSISDNGAQLCIVDGVYGYTYTIATGVFARITSAGFVACTTVTFLNGYFVASKANSGQWCWSDSYDGTSWQSLNFFTAESNPDNLVSVHAEAGALILFGDATTEFWGGSGDSAVWRRIGGAGIEWGLAARWSVAKFSGGLIYLAKNRQGECQVVVLNGYTVTPVSDPDVAHDINNRAGISAATGFSYMLDGHPFYQLNFPDKSYLYDGLSNIWSEVQSDGGRHWGEVRYELLSQPYVSDYRDGNIYRVDKTVYTDNGTAILRRVQSRHLSHDLDRFTAWEVVVEFEAGVGLTTGQGSDPQAMLQVSKDNGKTWGNERWASIGAIGAYLARVVWRRLGRSRDWIFRLSVTDPVKVVIVAASLRLE